ncbi:MAG: DHH family phosphoesterase [Deltaproteobacteria bacterium]|nr:DHH family phosphoesterase [Deltaproteobacteria bacterium]
MLVETIPLPSPIIQVRPINEKVHASLLKEGTPDWLADLLARRLEEPVGWEDILRPALSAIPDPARIPGLDKAVERCVRAIADGEEIIFTCDHDLDGTASAAVLWQAFTEYFGVAGNLLGVVTSHRLNEGYGLTEAVLERILATDATLVITADKGSSDEERIARLAAAGRDVIVTDHHALPKEGPPASAYAVINPTRADADYDPNICGAAVAFLLMAKIRSRLVETGIRKDIPSLAGLVDLVAVATVADCVALRPDRSPTNRALVKYGLALLNEKKRAAWQVFCADVEGPVTAETVAFRLAPPVAACGRLDWPEAGLRFLLAGDRLEAEKQWDFLKGENRMRQSIERELREQAFQQAIRMSGQSLVLYFDDGHSGVHGITASRLAEAFGKPAALFAPKGRGARGVDENPVPGNARPLATGSFRGVPGFHVREALQWVADRYPGLLCGFGGHEGAAGATVAIEDFPRFEEAFEAAVVAQLGTAPLRPALWVDGDWPAELLTLETLDILNTLDPWGKDFPSPMLKGDFEVASCQTVGGGKHLRLGLIKDGCRVPAIWFNAQESAAASVDVAPGSSLTLVYRLNANYFRGQKSVQLQITGLESTSGKTKKNLSPPAK